MTSTRGEQIDQGGGSPRPAGPPRRRRPGPSWLVPPPRGWLVRHAFALVALAIGVLPSSTGEPAPRGVASTTVPEPRAPTLVAECSATGVPHRAQEGLPGTSRPAPGDHRRRSGVRLRALEALRRALSLTSVVAVSDQLVEWENDSEDSGSPPDPRHVPASRAGDGATHHYVWRAHSPPTPGTTSPTTDGRIRQLLRSRNSTTCVSALRPDTPGGGRGSRRRHLALLRVAGDSPATPAARPHPFWATPRASHGEKSWKTDLAGD